LNPKKEKIKKKEKITKYFDSKEFREEKEANESICVILPSKHLKKIKK